MHFRSILLLLGLALTTNCFAKKDEWPVVLTKLEGRPGKTLVKAAYGRGGQLGSFFDVDADGNLEFVALERDGKDLSLTVLQIDSDRYSMRLEFGRAAAAGLTAINLDDDPQLEIIAAYGQRLEGLKKGLVLFASGIFSAFTAVPVASIGGHTLIMFPVLVPGSATDLESIVAVDDDGSIMWQRDFPDDGSWDETRFKWVVPNADGSGVTILITDDEKKAMLGLSSDDGRTLWSYSLTGGGKPSKRTYTSLIDEDRLLPVLFSPGHVLVLDPDTGLAEYDGELKRRITEFPSWHIFRVDDERRFLAFGEDRGELNMISLDTGEISWTHQSDEIIDVMPLPGGDQFIAVTDRNITFIDGRGEVVAEHKAPDKIKAKYPPVYRDINNDGDMEFIFVSGKNILCWELATNRLRWEAKMSGIVGGAHPTQLYDTFYDINGDGWLDIPARRGGGTGRWLSGDTGEILTEVRTGINTPIIGDWDGNGRLEMFWYKTWYEVSLAR